MARPAADRSAPALSAALGRLGRSLGLATATGYIWLFYSERVFWSFWRAEDGVAALLATWAVYSVAAHAALIAIWRFHVRGLAAVLLIGAFFGWLIEGVFAMTLFGADGIPFPLTISWTGLAWHDLISVTIGWYALQLAMRRGPRPTAALALSLGVFWGLWSLSWIAADRGATPGLAAFAVHAFAATAAMIAASYAYCELRCSDFAPGRVEQALTAAVILAWLGGLTLPRLGARAIVLVPLFGLLWWGLRRTRATATGPDLLALLAAPIDRRSVPVLLLMPAAAALIYSLCRTAGLTPATNILVFVITTPAGFIALIAGLVAVCRRTRRI